MKYVILILLVVLIFLLLLLYLGVMKFVKAIGFNTIKELIEEIKKQSTSEKEIYSRPKNLSDMTKLLIPLIANDFPSFNQEQLFAQTKTNINAILDSLESKDSSLIKDSSLKFIRPKVEDQIKNLNELDKNVKYTNVRFNKCAISEYTNKGGVAKITVVTSLSYYYDSNDEKEKKFIDVRKETRYKLEYVYIYDEDKIPENIEMLKINCPNCGAPIDFFGRGKCSYCNTMLSPINIKNWSVVNYEEY
jgi:lipopolysaccharide export LptBFGC system permease protein LptF